MHVIGTPVEDDGIFNAKLSETSYTSTTTTSNFESISIFFHLNEVAKHLLHQKMCVPNREESSISN